MHPYFLSWSWGYSEPCIFLFSLKHDFCSISSTPASNPLLHTVSRECDLWGSRHSMKTPTSSLLRLKCVHAPQSPAVGWHLLQSQCKLWQGRSDLNITTIALWTPSQLCAAWRPADASLLSKVSVTDTLPQEQEASRTFLKEWKKGRLAEWVGLTGNTKVII